MQTVLWGTIVRQALLRRRNLIVLIVLAAAAVLSGCAGVPRTPREGAGGGHRYCVNGYGCYRALASAAGYDRVGIASWYGVGDAGKPTASGAPYDPDAMTAASKELPFGTWVQVTNLDNGRQAVAMVNDRGPFHGGRILDVSVAVARRLAMIGPGTARVRVSAIPEERLDEVQREAAHRDAQLAVRYRSRHPVIHLLAGGVGLAARGGFYVVRDGVGLGLDITGGVLRALLP